MTIRQDVAELRRAAGLGGDGCPECRDRPPVVRVEMPEGRGGTGPSEAVPCPSCGRDVRTVIEIVFVTPGAAVRDVASGR